MQNLKIKNLEKWIFLLINEMGEFWRLLFYFCNFFDFLIFCCLLLRKQRVQKIGKSSCEIRGGGGRILAFFVRKMKVQKFRKNKCFTFKWIGRVLASPFIVLQLFDFFWFFASIVEKTEGENIGKSSCEIRGGGARGLPILLLMNETTHHFNCT